MDHDKKGREQQGRENGHKYSGNKPSLVPQVKPDSTMTYLHTASLHIGQHTTAQFKASSAISLPLEVEVQVQNASLKCAFETLLVTVLPLLVDDAESTIFIWRASMNPAQCKPVVM